MARPIDSNAPGPKRRKSDEEEVVAPAPIAAAAPLHVGPGHEVRLAALVQPPLEDDLHLGAALEELAEDGNQPLAVAGDDQDRMIVPMLARRTGGADAVRDGGIVRTE